jgi:hypothetical protein
MLKIDFQKEFYKVEYNAIIAMLRARGFRHKWISLIDNIMNPASTLISSSKWGTMEENNL